MFDVVKINKKKKLHLKRLNDDIGNNLKPESSNSSRTTRQDTLDNGTIEDFLAEISWCFAMYKCCFRKDKRVEL